MNTSRESHKYFETLGQVTREARDQLETFSAPPDVKSVTMETEEFTSLCPVTGAPDYSTVRIEYSPDKKCLESKSLKLYLWTFREKGVFCEALSSEIAHHLFDILEPLWIMVLVRQNPRGGVAIEARSIIEREM